MRYLISSKSFTKSKSFIRLYEDSSQFYWGDYVKVSGRGNFQGVYMVVSIIRDDYLLNDVITGEYIGWVRKNFLRELTDLEIADIKILLDGKRYNI